MWKKKALAIGLSFACLFGVSGIIAKSNENSWISIKVDGTDGPDIDDSKVIQEYLDRAPDGKDSPRIDLRLPEGTYYIYKQLIIHSNTNLILDQNATIVRMDPTKGMIRSEMKTYASNNEPVGGYGQVSKVIIQGGTWDGNSNSDTVSPPIMYLAHGSDVTLQNFQVKNQCSRHMVILAGISKAKVSNVKLSDFIMFEGEDADQEFFTSEGESGVTDHELSMRTMEALHLDCISKDGLSEPSALPIDGTVNKEITVTGCTFENLKSGVGSHYMADEKLKGSGLTIDKNTFKNVEYTCIDIYNQNGATITGNTATNVGELVRAVQSNTMTVAGNTVTCNTSKEGSSLTLCGIKTDKCKEIDINTNKITQGMHGISLTNSIGKVTGNTVTKAEMNGITLPEQSVIDASANTIKNAGITGIYYDKSYGTISGNTIDASKSHAIAVYASTKGRSVSITNNTITNPKEHGICVNASLATVTGNKIDNVKEHGIYALEGSKADIEKNKIGMTEGSTTGKNGIYLNAAISGSIVKDNEIGRTGENGILIFATKVSSSSKLDVSGNKVESGANGNGIRLEESDNIALKGNRVSDCKQSGIQMYHAKGVDITGCYSLKNTVEAIYAYDTSNVVVTGNTLSCILPGETEGQNTGGPNGKTDQSASTDTDLTEAQSGHPNGITAEASLRFTASGNTIEQCENGIVISGGTTEKLAENTITAPLDRGIWVIEGAKVTNIMSNTITNAGNYGIHIYEASAPLIESNPITNVGKIGIYVFGGSGSASLIKANTVTTTGDSGIRADNIRGLTIQNNEVTNTKGSAIHGFCDNTLTVDHNTINGNQLEGIAVYDTTKTTIVNNAIDPGTKVKLKDNSYGIAVYNTTTADVSGNTITSENTGILLNASFGSVAGNSIQDMAAKGIWAYDCQKYMVTVDNNTITNTKAQGIHFYNSKGSMDGNTLTNTAQNTTDGTVNGAIQIYKYTGNKNTHCVLKNNNITTSGASGVRVDESSFVDLTDNQISSTGKTGVHLFKTSYAEITGKNTIVGNAEEAIAIYDSNTVKVQGVTIGGSDEFAANKACNAITVATSKEVSLVENTLNGALNAILYSKSTGSITGNALKDVAQKGIWCTDGSNVAILGNEIPAPGTLGIHLTDSTGSIEKNKITSPKDAGIYVYGAKGTAKAISTVKENTVSSPGSFGIKIERSEYVTADGNILSDANSITLNAVDSKNVSLMNSVITGNVAEGIGGFNCSSLEISGNQITPGDQIQTYADGIKLDGSGSGSADVTVKNNAIKGARNGLNIFAVSSGTAEGNVLNNIQAKGIWVQGNDQKAARMELVGNTITSPAENGIQFYKATGSVTANTITDAGKDGILFYEAFGNDKALNIIQNNTIQRPKANGISMTDTAAGVSENTITGAGKIGIYGKGSKGTDQMVLSIDKNTIAGTGEQGLKYDGSAYLKIQGNAISATAKAALNLYQTSNTQIVGNDISTNKAEGIYAFEGNNIEVSENSVDPGKDIAGSGTAITLSGIKNASVEKNKVNHSGRHGICITSGSSNAKVNNNTVQNSAEHGIIIDSCTEMTVDGNQIEGSGKKEITALNNSTGSGKGNRVSVDEVYTYDPARFPIEYVVGSKVDVTVQYRDVPKGQWFVGAVQFAYDNGIMNGIAPDLFDPNGKLTRAQFVTVLHNMENKPQVDYQDIFTDVPNGEWFSNPVIWAYNLKITSGIGGGQFGTKNIITREQLATMLYSYAKTKGLDASHTAGAIDGFADRDKVDTWAEEAMNWAVSHGVMSGNGAGLDPRGEANRAQCAQMIKNLKEKVK